MRFERTQHEHSSRFYHLKNDQRIPIEVFVNHAIEISK